jgi:hypothetical protein
VRSGVLWAELTATCALIPKSARTCRQGFILSLSDAEPIITKTSGIVIPLFFLNLRYEADEKSSKAER